MKLSAKSIYLLLFIYSAFMLVGSFVLQYGFALTPCPLCLIARFFTILLTVIAGIAYLHNPGKRGRISYTIVMLTLTLLGILVSARHLWIMSLPAELVPSCTPGLEYLLESLPIFDALLVILHGSGECAQSDGLFLGLSLPAWTLVAFIGLAFGSLLPAFSHPKKEKGS